MTQPTAISLPGESNRRRRRRGAARGGPWAWPSSIGCARGRTADSATVPGGAVLGLGLVAGAGRAGGAAPRPSAGCGPAGG